jgi:hypothetical protein
MFPLVAQAQPDVWKQVNPLYDGPRLQSALPSKVQQLAIARLILHCCGSTIEETWGSRLADVVRCMAFEEIPLAAKRNVLLISNNGFKFPINGTGGGGAIWLVRLSGDVPTLLASPEDDFYGWLYSVQPSISHGYHDLVLGWHMSAGQAMLTYFQFNGKSYVSVSRAIDLCDQGCRIDPRIADREP